MMDFCIKYAVYLCVFDIIGTHLASEPEQVITADRDAS